MSIFPIEVRPTAFGIALSLYPDLTTTASIEVQRAPDSAGSPDVGSAVTVGTVPGSAPHFVDLIGGAGPYHYRARHVRLGATPGAWTSWVKARPVPLPGELPDSPELNGVIHRDTTLRVAPDAFTESVLQEIIVPARALALTRDVEIDLTMRTSTAFANADIRVRLNGQVIYQTEAPMGTDVLYRLNLRIGNTGTTDSQYTIASVSIEPPTAYNPGGLVQKTSQSEDSTEDLVIEVTAQKDSDHSLDEVELHFSRAELKDFE